MIEIDEDIIDLPVGTKFIYRGKVCVTLNDVWTNSCQTCALHKTPICNKMNCSGGRYHKEIEPNKKQDEESKQAKDLVEEEGVHFY